MDTDEDSNGYLILAEYACFNYLFLLLSIVEVLLISSLPFLVSATLGITPQDDAIWSKGGICEDNVCLPRQCKQEHFRQQVKCVRVRLYVADCDHGNG